MADRATVLKFAQAHGSKAAAARFGVKPGTIRSWQSRERRRSAQAQADTERAAERAGGDGTGERPSPLADFEAQARRLAAWAAGGCITCAGDGVVDIPAVHRGSLLIRRARRLPCPTCGGPVRRIQVNELPRAEWVEGMRRAGDLGAGWTPEQWAQIRAGEAPDGYRFTDGDRLEPGADQP